MRYPWCSFCPLTVSSDGKVDGQQSIGHVELYAVDDREFGICQDCFTKLLSKVTSGGR